MLQEKVYHTLAILSHQPVGRDRGVDHTAIAELVGQFILEQGLAQEQVAQLLCTLLPSSSGSLETVL